jgi:hypothetical protein
VGCGEAIVQLRAWALASMIFVAGCSKSEHRPSGAVTPTAPTGVATASDGGGEARPAVVDRSAPGGGSPNVAQDVAFPPRNEPFDFRLRLEAQYENVLRRGPQTSFVDIEAPSSGRRSPYSAADGCDHATNAV